MHSFAYPLITHSFIHSKSLSLSGLSHSIVLVIQRCLILCDPTNCSPPGFSFHGILQARILEWIAVPFSRGSSWPRNRTLASCIAGRFFTVWEDVRRFYANTMPCDRRALSICGFWYPLGSWTLKPVLGSFGLRHFWVYFWLQTTWSYLKIGGLFISIM